MALKDIETFVIVIMENRSFDHALGYLSTSRGEPRLAVDGISDDPDWRVQHTNLFQGRPYPVELLSPSIQVIDDPPHEHSTIAMQITTPPKAGPALKMGGFVASYMTRQPAPVSPSLVMGYYDAASVATFDFFARNFTVCDHWFAALPTGTQANRLMAMSGESRLVDNATTLIPDQPLVYDWLTAHHVPWCAYQWGNFFPFFSLMSRWLPEIMTSISLSEFNGKGRFRRYERFHQHWQSSDEMPSVIFIEPEYTDGPHHEPNDDHPPTGIAKGQALLADLYNTLVSNPNRWKNTMMLVFYDEHGGFFDHVPPLNISTDVAGHLFPTTGVRVPAFLISPHVKPGVPFSGPLDHTSMLQMLADRFNPLGVYSPAVSTRQPVLARLSEAIISPPSGDGSSARMSEPSMTAVRTASVRSQSLLNQPSPSAGAAANAQAFNNVALKVAREHPELVAGPGWRSLADYVGFKGKAA